MNLDFGYLVGRSPSAAASLEEGAENQFEIWVKFQVQDSPSAIEGLHEIGLTLNPGTGTGIGDYLRGKR